MNTPRPDLDQLKELALPASVSYLPQTWGWFVLTALLVLGLACWAGWRYRNWQQNRYRREALQRLAQLEHAIDADSGRLSALRELPELLKRVALSIPGQPGAASLSGASWQGFLEAHSDSPLPSDFNLQLAALAYDTDARLQALDADQREQLLRQCRDWVEHHHVAA